MRKKPFLFSALALTLLMIIGGFWLYDWVLGDTEAASETLAAPTLVIENTATVVQPVVPTATAEIAATAAKPTEPQPEQNSSPANSSTVVFEINQDESEVRFNIYELLRDAPKDVIGVTNQVAGQVALDLSDLSTARVGEILINARALATDDDRRNQAIRNRILFTDQYEYIRFIPTRIIGLQGAAVVGQSITFQVEGELTIRDVTKPVVFDITVTGESLERIAGSAKTVIQRADFNLNIPEVPFVANVADEITLEIDLVLVAG